MRNTVAILHRTFYQIRPYFMLFLIMLLCGCEDLCPPIREYHNAGIGENCLLCKVFKIISDASLACAEEAWAQLAKPLRNVVVLVGAIYIAVNTFKMVSSFGKQTVADYMTGDKRGLLLYMFKLTVIVLLLSESTDDSLIINDIMVPILQAGIEIGSKLSLTNFMTDVNVTGRGWASLFDLVNQAVEQFSDAIYETIAIGEAMVCNATLNSFFGWYFLMLLYGFILFIFGWIILIGVSFYMVDILIRLTFAAILLPLGIACAISKLTIGYTKNIWNLFLNVFFSFMMLGIILGIAIQMVLLSMGKTPNPSASFGSPALNAFLNDFDAQIDANAIKSLAQELWSNGSLLLTLICFALTVQLLEQMDKIAGDISDTGGFASISPGKAVGAALAKKPMEAGKKMTGYAVDSAINGAKYAGHVASRVTRADKLYRWSGRQAQAMRGFLTGTGAQGYNAMWHKQTQRKIRQGANRRATVAKPYVAAAARKVAKLWRKITR